MAADTIGWLNDLSQRVNELEMNLAKSNLDKKNFTDPLIKLQSDTLSRMSSGISDANKGIAELRQEIDRLDSRLDLVHRRMEVLDKNQCYESDKHWLHILRLEKHTFWISIGAAVALSATLIRLFTYAW